MSSERTIAEYLCGLVSQIPDENPLEYFDKIYANIHPIMMSEAIKQAKTLIKAEESKSKKSQNADEVDVYLTLGGENLNKSFYTGVIATLLWLPEYLKQSVSKFGVSKIDADTCQKVLNACHLPVVHDVSEEVINGIKVQVEPSSVRHYSAFLASIISWCNSGITDFTVKGKQRSNMELARYLSSAALNTFPSIPFAAYHIGTVKSEAPFELAEKMGKSMKWTDYMSDENYQLNEPKFVCTVHDAPIVSIPGHPLTDTFVAEVRDGNAKWLGIFVENEEFVKLCAKEGLTTDEIKKYIIEHTLDEHRTLLAKHHPVAVFLEKQKMIKEAFKLKEKFSCANVPKDDKYDM
jgi:hypothetical protein